MYPLDSHCTCAQITKLVYEVSEEDVVRARNQLKSSILFSIDGSGGERPSIHLACESACRCFPCSFAVQASQHTILMQ